MNIRIGLRALAALLAGALLAGAALSATTTGSGQRTSESRTVPDFESIALSASMKLIVRQTDRVAVQVQADDNLLPLIETKVESHSGTPTLIVRFRKGEDVRHRDDIVVTVDVVRLTGISASGSGSIEMAALKTPSLNLAIAGSGDAAMRGLTTESLEIVIAGSGDVKAAGQARQLKLSIAGSGDADLGDVIADDVKVGIAGSGNAQLTANESLSVSIAGSGDVRYSGKVSGVKSSVMGSGSVRRR